MNQNHSQITFASNREFNTSSIIIKSEETEERFEKMVLPLLKRVVTSALRINYKIGKTCIKVKKEYYFTYSFTTDTINFEPLEKLLRAQVYDNLKSICCDQCAVDGFRHIWSDKGLGLSM
jgi:hypothetical protein